MAENLEKKEVLEPKNKSSGKKKHAQALANADESFYSDLADALVDLGENVPRKEIDKLKRKLSAKYRLPKIPTNIEVYLRVPVDKRDLVKKKLMTKPVRSISGVSPIAIMTKPIGCPHGRCIYCPGGPGSVFGDVPQSYTGKEPASMRAIRNKFDAYLQVFNRLEQYVILGHSFTKNDVIIMGGTFPSFPLDYQDEFIALTYKAMNDFSEMFFDSDGKFDLDKFIAYFELPGDIRDAERTKRIQKKLLKHKNLREARGSKRLGGLEESEESRELGEIGKKGEVVVSDLEEEKRRNDEESYVKCIGLTIETKPDWALLDHAKQMLRLGCTRVELGVQTTNAEITARTNRGHSQEETVESIKVLRDLGFKLNFHMMPGLPGSSEGEDVKMLCEVVSDSRYMPDMLKIYPCMVMPGTPLKKLFDAGKFEPMETDGAIRVISSFIEAGVPEWVRIMRVQRDIPTYRTTAGVDKTNLRQMLEKQMNEKGIVSRDIRAREPKRKEIDFEAVELVVRSYDASAGKEYFISFEDLSNDLILGFIRLRFPNSGLVPEINSDSALIRELHVYGQALALGKESSEGVVQHKGFGRKLLAKAEEIAREACKKKMVIISGVGVRGYYEKFGYKRDGPYMSKNF